MKLLVIPGVSFLISCENDIEKIQSIASTYEVPQVYGENIEVLYSDSGYIEMKLTAAEIKRFANNERPFTEFPKGIYVELYDDSLNVESFIQADYAIYYQEEKLWEARGNVVAHNMIEERKLNTEELFWDEEKEIIYSNTFSRIETPDGTSYGQEGFEANQNFSKIRLKSYKGTINYKEENNNEEQDP